MASPATPLLAVADLKVSFHRAGAWHEVVHGLSFGIAPGETLAIVGESGSGKSVTALSVLGLLPPAATRITGSIRLGGRELLALSPREIAGVRGREAAMIFQEPMTSLNPVMSIGHQIREALDPRRGLDRAAARAETLRLMERVRIPAAASRYGAYPHEFSGGMRQRVMIAIALACRPRLLIADEPTTALDVTIQAQILDLIKDLQREEGMGVLFITHDMGVVAEVADRTLVMFRGEGVECGPTAEVFAAPRAPYTRALLSAVPRLGAMAGTPGPRPFAIVDLATGAPAAQAHHPDTVDPARDLLTVEGLTARFDIRTPFLRRVKARVHAVENVSFALRRGETLALVGESGCGKSTTGRMLAGLLPPTRGEVVVDGRRMERASRRGLARHIQMVFQDPFASLNPRLRVGDAIAEPLRIQGLAGRAEAAATAAALIARVGLPRDAAGRYPHEFSGGQRQRICIARALALKPSVIVADEAVSALDVSVKAQVVNLLLELQRDLALGLVFISHDMAVVERVGHRVAVMYGGEIVEIGPRAAVFGAPRHPYTRRLLDAVPVPDPARRGHRHALAGGELRSPIRAPDHRPPARGLEEVAPGHFLLPPGPEWEGPGA